MWPKCLVLALLVLPETASAQNAIRAVDVVIAAAYPSDVAAIREDLQELLGRIGVTGRYRQQPAIDPSEVVRSDPNAVPVLARVWLDLAAATPDRAIVYLADAKWQRVLVRYVALTRGLDEVARQEVSHIVASSVDALKSGADLEVAEQGDVLLQVRPPSVNEPGGGRWMTVGVAGGASRWTGGASAVPAFGMSLALGRGAGNPEPSLWLNAAYQAMTAAGDPVSLRLRGAALSILALAGFGAGNRITLRVGGGPGMDVMSAAPVLAGNPAGVRLDPERWITSYYVRAGGRIELRMSRLFVAFLAAVCDLQVASSRYVLERSGVADPVFEPAKLRPSAMIGLEAAIFGRTK